MKRLIPIVIVVFSLAGTSFGNGLGGQRLEKVVGDQIVDIGTDQTSTPQAGTPIQFDFNLLKSDTRVTLSNTNVAVDIEHNGQTMIKNNLIMESPITLMVYTFPEGGDYTLTTTFYDKGRALAAASFTLTIAGGTTREFYIEALIVSILLGLLGGYWVGRRRRSKIAG